MIGSMQGDATQTQFVLGKPANAHDLKRSSPHARGSLQSERLEDCCRDELAEELLPERREVDVRGDLEVAGRVVGAAVRDDALPGREGGGGGRQGLACLLACLLVSVVMRTHGPQVVDDEAALPRDRRQRGERLRSDEGGGG